MVTVPLILICAPAFPPPEPRTHALPRPAHAHAVRAVVATGAARVAMPLVMETAAAAARVAVARVVAPDAAPGRPSGHGR